MVKIVLAIVFLSISTLTVAQNIRGIVIDSLSLDPLPGASIVESITNTVTTTDSKGRFEIKVGFKANLTASFVGYIPFKKK